jgi:hypothetical protein
MRMVFESIIYFTNLSKIFALNIAIKIVPILNLPHRAFPIGMCKANNQHQISVKRTK